MSGWMFFWAVVLGIVANEVFDLMPWMAGRLLRLSARLNAAFPGEAALLLAESEEMLKEIPGKLTKLVFALGRMSFAPGRHVRVLWGNVRKRALQVFLIVFCLVASAGVVVGTVIFGGQPHDTGLQSVIEVALSLWGMLTVLASSVSVWLRQRRSTITVTLIDGQGKADGS